MGSIEKQELPTRTSWRAIYRTPDWKQRSRSFERKRDVERFLTTVGEMAALRVGRVDFLRRRALIAESVTLVKGTQTWGTPKGHDRREVPIPRFLSDQLAVHVSGKGRGDLVFTMVEGGALRSQGFQRAVMTNAAIKIGVAGLHPHELRHTAASLAIASGANDVKVVQRTLGHKSAAMTPDLYGHLFPTSSTRWPLPKIRCAPS